MAVNDFENLVDDVNQQEDRHRRALRVLLDEQLDRKDHVVAALVRMGKTRSYIASVSLEWVAQKLKFASELPLFKDHIDPETRSIKIDKRTVGLIRQRNPDWRRQVPMTLYLAMRETHKFPPILAVLSQPWVDDLEADEWNSEGRAVQDSVSAQTLDTGGEFAILHVAERDMVYALDGQHRLMAIKGLMELAEKGELYFKSQEGRDKATRITVDEIIEECQGRIHRADLQALPAERIGVEIIPAVRKDETRDEAVRRVRSIFVHVNRTPVSLTQGELALLDEDDGFKVVARSVMVTHPLLSAEGRVEAKVNQLSKKSTALTTLEALVGIAEQYLGQFEVFGRWKSKRAAIPLRPPEDELDAGHDRLMKFFDELARLPSYKRVLDGASPIALRALPEEDEEGRAHLLFRPIGQVAVAEAVGVLENRKPRSVTLSAVIDMLARKEEEDGLRIDRHETPWYGVVFDPVKRRMHRSGHGLCARMLIHVLGGGTEDEKAHADLRTEFAQARVFDPEREEGARDLDGREVRPEEIKLPSPW